MIKNERQYKITKAQAEKFASALASYRRDPSLDRDLHPLLRKAQEDALESQLADLESELQEYDALKAGQFSFDQLGSIADLPKTLIRARIARGMSQRELADLLGLKEQQIQRYEATDYEAASLSRIREVAAALGADLGGKLTGVI
jgi:ribosome-binding protein aMBF1 (putative translation factor)